MRLLVPECNVVVVPEPKLDNLSIATSTDTQSGKMTKPGKLMAEDLFNNMLLYTFRPEDLMAVGATWKPTKIMTLAHSLVVSFEPEK
jgi:hypothetical protein